MMPDNKSHNAVIQGSSMQGAVVGSEGITMRELVGLVKAGEDPNNSIPFMAMNRASRRQATQIAKRLSKRI